MFSGFLIFSVTRRKLVLPKESCSLTKLTFSVKASSSGAESRMIPVSIKCFQTASDTLETGVGKSSLAWISFTVKPLSARCLIAPPTAKSFMKLESAFSKYLSPIFRVYHIPLD